MPATGPVLSGELRRRGTMGPRVKPAGDDWRGGRADKAPPAPRPDAPCTQIVIPAKRPQGARLAEIGRATSGLQSLMRISYAVFCLEKNKTHRNGALNEITNTVL